MLKLNTQVTVKRPAINNKNNLMSKSKQNVAFAAGPDQEPDFPDRNSNIDDDLTTIAQALLSLMAGQQELNDRQVIMNDKLSHMEKSLLGDDFSQQDPSDKPSPDYMYT